ncbi:hypothetical protein NDK25_13585 [Niallia taxi]|nr:hypothetical protein [Niallia taxi]MDE5053268.1 hypothetical protein [Niallia taxi]
MQTIKSNIYDLFAYYQDEDFYYINIPEKMLSYINRKFNIPYGETVIAFLHCRFNTSICFTENGVYWKLVGQKKGNFSWGFLNDVTHIKVEKDDLYLDNEKILMLAGTTYPQELLVQLLEEIKKRSIVNEDYHLNINYSNISKIFDDVLHICNTFKGDDDCLVCNVLNADIKIEDSISVKTKKALRTKIIRRR